MARGSLNKLEINWVKVGETRLVEVFGARCTASEMLKKIWVFIKAHNLMTK